MAAGTDRTGGRSPCPGCAPAVGSGPRGGRTRSVVRPGSDARGGQAAARGSARARGASGGDVSNGWPGRLLQGLGWIAGVAAAIALALAVGGVMPSRPLVAVIAGLVVLAFGLTLVDAAVIPLLAVLPLFVSFRAVL